MEKDANDAPETESYDDYELSPEQIRDMKFDQWSCGLAGLHITDENMLRYTKRFYATGQDKEFRELIAKAKRENKSISEVLKEHRKKLS